MSEVVNLIQNVGFPIFMCLVFIFRFEKILNNNTTALTEVCKLIKNRRI